MSLGFIKVHSITQVLIVLTRLKPKIDDDHVDAILTIDLDRQNKKARSADEAYDQITYDQINHEVIHEAPDSPVELALPPPP